MEGTVPDKVLMETPTFVEEIHYTELQFGEIVGKGAFGVVSRAKWRGKDVAVKRIETESEKKAFMQELKQLSRVSHPNIVCLYGACREYPVCLVMEYAEGGSLYNVLHGSGPQPDYTAAHAISWLLQCARGVEYLHGMKPKALVHRDLKPPNLLLIQYGKVLKICDFGTACDCQTYMTNNKGSAAWMAPEVFEGSNYSEKCDVFSWGIILWEVLTRRKPFDETGGPAFRIMWAVHSGKRPPLIRGLPQPLELLMTRCWSGNPAERPSMAEVVRIMSHLFKYFHGADQPLTIPRSSLERDEDPANMSSRENLKPDVSTPSNKSDTPPSPPSVSRTGTISDTVRCVDIPFKPRNAPPVVVEEKKVKGQLSAPPSLAASRESLNEPRSRSGTPVDSGERNSVDLDQHDFTSHGAATAQRVLGHRRSGSQGTTPNFVTTNPLLMGPSPVYQRGLGRFASHDALVPSVGIVPPSIVVTPSASSPHVRMGHRRTGSDERTCFAGSNFSSPSLSIVTQEQFGPTSPMQHCPTYPGELSTQAGRSPPARTVSYQPPNSRETISVSARASASGPQAALLQQGYHDADTKVIDTASLYIALEPHLQPLAPYPTSTESMKIFEEHSKLAVDYMRIQAEIAVLMQRKQELDQEMKKDLPQPSHRNYEEYTRLYGENESLLKYLTTLKQTVEDYRKNAKQFPTEQHRTRANH